MRVGLHSGESALLSLGVLGTGNTEYMPLSLSGYLYNKKQSGKSFHATRKRMHQRLKLVRNGYISDYLEEAIETNHKQLWSFMKPLKNMTPEKQTSK